MSLGPRSLRHPNESAGRPSAKRIQPLPRAGPGVVRAWMSSLAVLTRYLYRSRRVIIGRRGPAATVAVRGPARAGIVPWMEVSSVSHSRHDTLLSRLRERHLTGECGPQETRGLLPGEASQCRCRPDRARPGSGSAWSWKAGRVRPPPSPWLAAEYEARYPPLGPTPIHQRSLTIPTHRPEPRSSSGASSWNSNSITTTHGRASHTTFRQLTCAADERLTER